MHSPRFIIAALLFCCVLYGAPLGATAPNYEAARSLGQKAAERAAGLLDLQWESQKVVVLTNAKFARPGGFSSRGCLDGLATETGTSTGSSTLLSLQSRFDQPLWFAFYSSKSGKCAYLQADRESAEAALSGKEPRGPVFALEQAARIDAEHIMEHAREFRAKAEKGLFGDNLFRVVTCANAAMKNSPDDLLTAIQTHDHHCPGVTSGVLMVRFIRERILSGASEADCFVLSLEPWCKEDALTTLLNATPGKRGYGTVYPTKQEAENWPEPLSRADTIVFLKHGSQPWRGWMLRFNFDKANRMFSGQKTDSPFVNKLAMDLWFADYLDEPELFVDQVGSVELEEGRSPKALLSPGSDPVKILSGK